MKTKHFWRITGAVTAMIAVLWTAVVMFGADRLPSIVTTDWVLKNELNGVAGRDARKSDFTRLGPTALARLAFDSTTRWPDQSRLPAGFQPNGVLEAAKDPGLGLRELHQLGITGTGINVAMIDKYILPDHQELAGRIKYIEVFPGTQSGRTPHFHGMATASILAGATVGVAPGAHLYYFAVPNDSNGFKNYITALEQLLRLNATLPGEQKIRVVSVSWGPGSEDSQTKDAWLALVSQAQAEGLEIVYSKTRTVANYVSAGVLPGRDRNDRNAYDWAAWVQNLHNADVTKMLGVPASYRTTASVAGNDAYAYWGDSGISWAIPYVAGLLALGLQVNPDAKPDDLYQALEMTASPNAQGVRMVNPSAFIAAVRK